MTTWKPRFQVNKNILKTTIIFFAVVFLLPKISLAACNFNGTCEEGETKDNCVFDCMVATNNKEVKIGACIYGTYEVTRFNLDGTVEYHYKNQNDGTAVKDFLIGNADSNIKVDLIDSGNIWINGEKYLEDYTSDIPAIRYLWGLGMMPYYCDYPSEITHDFCHLTLDAANNNEDWLLHQNGWPAVAENRVRRHYYGGYIFDNSNVEWRGVFSDLTANVITDHANVDGFFLDEVSTNFNTGLMVTNHTENQLVKEALDKNGGVHKYIQPNYQLYIYTGAGNPLTVTDKNNPSIQYAVSPWVQMNMIFFDDSNIPTGTEVTVNYYFQSTVDPNILTNWSSNYISLLQEVRQKIGGKLIIYNGFYANDDQSNFLQYADGGMKEGIFGYNIAESSWQQQLNQLKDISPTKMAYAFSYSEGVPEDKMQQHALFSFTSFLLGKGRYGYYQYAPSCQHFYWFDYWNTPLGNPSESYHLKGNYNGANIYEREYEKALVLVNPSDTNSSTIDLGKNYKTLTGSSISSISLLAKEGIILLQSCTPGDANNDKSINISDVQTCINVILGTDTTHQTCSDMNTSNTVDITDCQAIINKILNP